MSRLLDRPLDRVDLDSSGRPLLLSWRGRAWRVNRTTEVWKDAGCWWEGEVEKTFFRLEAAGGRLIEVYYDPQAAKWFLYRIYD
jgi:hypothetical protein